MGAEEVVTMIFLIVNGGVLCGLYFAFVVFQIDGVEKRSCYRIAWTSWRRNWNWRATALNRARQRRLHRKECRVLAKDYRDDGDEIRAVVLEAEADAAEREAVRLEEDAALADRWERNYEYRKLTRED